MVDDGARCASVVEPACPSASCSRRCCDETGYLDALEAERTIEAQGRDREPRRSSSRSRASTTPRAEEAEPRSRSSCRVRARRRRRHAQRRRGPRDADDAAQRQGPRVPDRVHDRHGGRRLPALARDRRGRPRGGAPARATSASPARCATLYLTYARRRAVCSARRRLRHALALPRRDPARADRPRRRRRASGPGSAAQRPGSWASRAPPEQPAPAFRLGDDVVARGVRRGRRHRGRAGWDRRRALRGRRLRAQADGRLRADHRL